MFRNISEMWKYRSLIWALVSRHLKTRYRGSFLGFVWSFLNPLCLILVYSLVFRYYIRFDGVPHYTLFLFAGLLPWIWFSSGLIEATAAISSGGSLITKAMFPPHILPAVSILTNLANFLFALPLLLVVMYLSSVPMTPALFALPVVIFLELLLLAGLGLAASAINVHFRDVQHILGNLISLLFFLCPIVYPVSSVPEKFQFTLLANPIALFTQMYHQMFMEGVFPGAWELLYSGAFACAAFAIGNLIFNRYREGFAELI